MRHAAILLAFLVAACNPPASQAIEGGEAEPAATSVPASRPDAAARSGAKSKVATLSGEWRVAAIDGISYDESVGLALSADAEEIWWEPRCAAIVHPYRIEGFVFRARNIAPSPASTAGPDGLPRPAPLICTIGPLPHVAEVSRAIRKATRIERTEQNGVLLSGGGHSLLLFSQ